MEKKRKIIQAVVCAVLVCLIWGGYFVVKHYDADRILDVKAVDFSFSWVYQFDSVENSNENLILRGFAFELDKDATKGAFEVVLRNIDSGEKTFLKMEYTEREDVDSYFDCSYDYLQSGFVATTKTRKMNLKEDCYEVLLKASGRQTTYQTGVFVVDGKLEYANPRTFKPLDVEGTGLEEITSKGMLRVYRPDYGMYVYQYNGELYWIAEQGYGFVDADTYVQYQIDTTQIERLPTERINNKWYWDNMGFLFSEEEVLDVNTGKYRVAKRALPTEYSISRIWTGNYIDEWIWQQYFRPYYEFDN